MPWAHVTQFIPCLLLTLFLSVCGHVLECMGIWGEGGVILLGFIKMGPWGLGALLLGGTSE
jgi:hypothetical protein